MTVHRTQFFTLVALAGLSLASCSPSNPTEPAAKSEAAASGTAPTLPVSINATMVALVDHASEPLWVAAYKSPKNAAAWKETEYTAYQVAVTGKLIQLAGTGPNDAKWVADAEWKTDADAMSLAGVDALRAAQAKDVKALDEAGSKLVEACESCHKKFKPSLTTGGLYKSASDPAKK